MHSKDNYKEETQKRVNEGTLVLHANNNTEEEEHIDVHCTRKERKIMI